MVVFNKMRTVTACTVCLCAMMVAVILMWCLFEGLAASSQFRVNSGDLQTIANSPRAGQIQDSPVITITDAGFVPSNITVSVGVTITWYNATNSTQDLIAQPTYRLFLPLIQNSADINGVQGASQEQANEQPGEERGIGGLQASQLAKIGVRGPFSGTIPPGQTLQQQFNTPGEFTQLLKNNPGIIGRIVIEQVRPTPGATPTPVDSATPTVTQEPAPTATATLTDTPIPSNTTETESTATPTVESTHTSTPTETPGVDDTATPTAIPTSTDTATPTSISTESPTPTATAIPSDTPTSTATDTATPTFTPTNTATNIPTPTATSTGPTNVCGTISADTTWGLGATPFIVTCPIRVANGATLTIEHGVEVRFRPNTGLRIEGVISATGTVDLPILLTSDASSPTPGNWTGIYFAPTSTGSVLEHVQMQYAGARYDLTHPDPAITTNTNFLFTLSSVYVDESDVTIRNSNIMSGTGPGLNVYQGAAVVEGSTISGMGSGQYNPTTTSTVNYRGYGVYGSNHTALDLRNNLISYNDERGVFLIGTNRIMLAGNNFVSNLDAVYLHGIQLLPGSGENQASGNRVNAIRIHDHIHVDEAIVYSNLPYVIDYLRVEAGRTLTIPAGQIFKPFNGNLTGLPRINILGTLVVQSTADEPVIFTSVYDDSIGGETYRTPTLPSPGDWTGFYFAPTSSGNALEHVEIRYAGAVYDLPHPDPAITTLANFPFTLSSVYVDESDVTIRNSNIMSGTGPGLNVYQGAAVIEGSTIADMNAGQHQPTTTSTFRYYGHGIYGSNFTALDLRNNFISHNNDRGVFLFGTKDIMLADNNFVSNFDAVRMQGVQLLPGSGNNQASGNRFNAILLYDHVHTNKTLVYSNLPYVVEYLRVEAGQTLTIPAGQVFKPASGNLTNLPRINILGAIAVQGTAEQPVVFTSIHDDTAGGNTYGPATQPAPGDWTGIYFAPTSSGSILEHMEVRYAGAKYDLPHNDPAVTNGSTTQFTASSIYVDESDITVHHNVISAGAGSGINVYGGRADVVGSIISSMQTAAITIAPSTYNYTGFGIFSVNANINLVGNEITKNVFGIYVRTPTTTYIRSNSIIGNSNYGLAANASQPIDARDNWWGSDSGPRPHGTGDRVNNVAGCFADCNIRVYNWLGQDTFVRQSLGDSGPAVVYQAKAGDPVNTANGNYYYSYTDLLIQTRSFPLGFARTYNSLLPQEGPLGWGWTHSWHSYLTENLDSSVMVVFGDGHGEKWFSDGAAFVGAPGVYGQLVKNGDGSYDLTQKNQTRYHFDNNLRLAYVEDKNNNRTTLAYDPQGRLTNVTEPAGRALTLSYASPISPTLISQVADHSGRAVSFTYDSAANLVKVTDVIGQELTITYDANHRLLTQTDANNHTFNTNVYDERGRVVEQFDADGNRWTFNYDVINNITVVTDPLGRSTTYDYDNELRLTAEIDALNKKMRYTYDANGNRIEVVDKRGYASSMSYDLRGNMLVMTDTLGFVSTHSYDSRNNLVSQTDARGNTTLLTYDAHSNLVESLDALGHRTAWTYNGAGQVISVTDARANTSSHAYDANGYLTSTTDALGNTTSFTYDSAGRLLNSTDALGRTITHTYDNANRLLTTSEPLGRITAYGYDSVGNRISVTDPKGNVSTFAYDSKDRLSSITNPLGHMSTFSYDALNNQIAVTNPLGNITTYSYDALNRRIAVTNSLGHQTSYVYDANGNRIRMTDANGNVTNYVYDARNLLTSVTDAEGGSVAYVYDAIGNRTSMTDANNHTTVYAYDVLNRLTSSTDPLGHVTSHSYDAIGNQTAKLKADGITIAYTYDALNRLIDTSYPGGNIQYAYDAISNRTAMTDTSGVSTYAYDAVDRLTQVTNATGTLAYDYDLNSNRTAITYPTGDQVAYTYDAANRLESVTDWGGRTTTYAYDAASRQTEVNYPNGVQAVTTYDSADRLLSLVNTHPTHGVIATASYTLDSVGNRLTMQDVDGTSTYGYDKLYRLTSVIYPDSEQVTYSYDPMGNRQSMNSGVHGVTSYSYDAGDRLLTFTEAGGATSLSWDDNGSLSSKGSATYTFDALERLTQVVSGTTTVQFTYDGDGVRLGKTVNGVTTSYVQDVAAPLPVVLVETVNGQAIRYVYGNDLLALVDPASTILFYHFDGSDSTTGLTDVTGTSVESYHYASFGSLRMRTGDSEQNMLFSGEQDDEEVNLLFLRARYYDSDAGRFISRDVFPVRTYQTQGISRYIYTQNNPIRFSDTSGLDRKENESFVINWVYAGGFRQSGESYRIVNNFLEVFNPLYNMAAKEYIFRFAKTRPIDTSLRPYIWGRAWLDQVNTVGDYITLGTHIMDSADRFQAGEVDSLEVGAGEFSAVAANTLNDIITGPGRSIAKLAVGKDVVSGIPVISQLDQDITGQQVVENIEGFMEMGPSKYFGCVWDVLSGRQCR